MPLLQHPGINVKHRTIMLPQLPLQWLMLMVLQQLRLPQLLPVMSMSLALPELLPPPLPLLLLQMEPYLTQMLHRLNQLQPPPAPSTTTMAASKDTTVNEVAKPPSTPVPVLNHLPQIVLKKQLMPPLMEAKLELEMEIVVIVNRLIHSALMICSPLTLHKEIYHSYPHLHLSLETTLL